MSETNLVKVASSPQEAELRRIQDEEQIIHYSAFYTSRRYPGSISYDFTACGQYLDGTQWLDAPLAEVTCLSCLADPFADDLND